MKNTTFLTLSQAAKQTGKSKSVISKALKDGTLSYNEKDSAGYKIDPAELFRVFPESVLEREENGTKERLRTPKNDNENGALEKEVEMLREQLAREKELNRDLSRRLDESDAERRENTIKFAALLTDQSENRNTGAVDRFKKFLWGNPPQKPDKVPTG